MADALSDPEQALTGFGFTPIESLIYCELLRTSPATGYRISQQIGKAAANTYQALKSLQKKGAVIAQDSGHDAVSYDPVPPEHLLAGLERGFAERKASALSALDTIKAPPSRPVVHQLRTFEQVMDRARAMLADAKETIGFDLVPTMLDLLADEIDAARARGVEITGIAYREGDERPGMPLALESGRTVETRWPGLGLIIVVDGEQMLVAQVARDLTGVLDAVFSDSLFLSCIMHTMLVADVQLNAIRVGPDRVSEALAIATRLPPGLHRVKQSVFPPRQQEGPDEDA